MADPDIPNPQSPSADPAAASSTPAGGPPPEAPPTGGGGGDGAAAPASPEGPDSPPAAPSPQAPQDWRDRRIAQLTARIKSAEERLAAAAATARSAPPTPGPTIDEAEIDRRASLRAAEQDFLRRCDDLASQGKQSFGAEWDGRVNSLRQLVDPNSQSDVVAWNNLLIAAMETGSGPQVLHELGANLNEAQRLLSLPVVRQATELTKMANRLEATKTPLPMGGDGGEGEPSSAPRPVRPVGGRGASHVAIAPDDPDRAGQLDIGTWMERRRQQVKERGLR